LSAVPAIEATRAEKHGKGRTLAVPGRLPVLPSAGSLDDRFGRRIHYLRISVTDRCNLRCVYCIPNDMEWLRKGEILSYEEIARLARIFTGAGVRRIRLTGGEPLVRSGIERLVRALGSLPELEDLALSTNGILLAAHAESLREAGLRRVNVSMDSLDAGKFAAITQGGDLGKVLEGIDAALAAGLRPVKINVVAARGFNDSEAADFARLTLDRDVVVRFIEIMPLGDSREFQADRFVSADEIIERIREVGPLDPCDDVTGSGPARYFRMRGGRGTIGFITPMSHTFCETCNRVRLTAAGQLRLCLFGDDEIDLRTPLRAGADDHELERLIRFGMTVKPESHHLQHGMAGCGLRALSQVGG
ncbi:MAG TPA: GTP 3',8-cyclase MoaA, partial [Candidatus Saccharimonadales bacterium]|nr:GTP 3',8-cyclase MoaA [Candidatus Saccharimonadales bacterium]